MCKRPMLRAPFTKKRTHNLGPIYLQKLMCWKDKGRVCPSIEFEFESRVFIEN